MWYSYWEITLKKADNMSEPRIAGFNFQVVCVISVKLSTIRVIAWCEIEEMQFYRVGKIVAWISVLGI